MPSGTCLRAHVVSQCTALPRTSIAPGDFWTGPALSGAIRTLQTFSGVISPYHSAEAADFGRKRSERGCRPKTKMNRRNTGPTGHRPRTRMKHQNLVSTNQRRRNTVTTSNVSNGVNHHRLNDTIHRYTVPPKHVKWVINEWNIGLEAISGTAPGQVGNCPLTISETDPSQTEPVPHQTGDRPPFDEGPGFRRDGPCANVSLRLIPHGKSSPPCCCGRSDIGRVRHHRYPRAC